MGDRGDTPCERVCAGCAGVAFVAQGRDRHWGVGSIGVSALITILVAADFMISSPARPCVHRVSLDMDQYRRLPAAHWILSGCAVPGDDPGGHLRQLLDSSLLA